MKRISEHFSNLQLLDLKYPDFSERHLFTTELRLLIYIGFWAVIIIYFPNFLLIDEPIMLLVSLTFLWTTVCYYFIMKGRWPLFFFLQEIIADLVAQTIVVYVTGGMGSNFFTLYVLYALVDGAFYNYRISFIIGVLAMASYGILWILLAADVIVPFQYVFHGSTFGIIEFTDTQRFTVLIVCLLASAYGAKIANHFSKLREMILEDRNREMTAINRIASTIRSVISLKEIVSEVLQSTKEGLGYDVCFLVHIDENGDKARLFLPEKTPFLKELKSEFKVDVDKMYLPLNAKEENSILDAINRREVVIKKDLAGLMRGVKPMIREDVVAGVQKLFGFRKLVIAPIVSEKRSIGAVIGITEKDWVGDDAVRAIEAFANQAALAIDNVTMIDELKGKNQELERVSKIKSEFLATMSHELRTPLTAIIGFSELLMEEVMGELNGEQKESVKEVLNNGEALLQLINSLLDLAKIEAGKMELIKETFPLSDLIESATRSVNPLILKKKHKLSVDVKSDIPLIYADQKRIQQILLNLLSNAIKFTPEGGRISVRASFEKDPATLKMPSGFKIKPELYQEGYFRIEVEDTGIGIKKKDIEHVFQMFTQVDRSYSRSYAGTGLGLPLIEQFSELHEGRVWVESEYGKGAKFIVVLPRIIL